MISKTASFVCSKHYAALKRLPQTDQKWIKAYQLIQPLFSSFQKNIFSLKKHYFIHNIAFYLNEFFLGGDYNHLILRKHFIRKWIQESIDNGAIDTLCIIGSGYDPLVYTLDNLPKNLILIDRPDMLFIQKKVHETIQHKLSIHYLSLDLNDPDSLLVLHNQLKEYQKTLFLTEGLLDYLEEPSAKSLIHFILGKCTNHKSQWISTAFCLPEMSTLNQFSFRNTLRAIGENLQWEYTIEQLVQLLEVFHLKDSTYICDVTELMQMIPDRYKVNEKKMNGFYLIRCLPNKVYPK